MVKHFCDFLRFSAIFNLFRFTAKCLFFNLFAYFQRFAYTHKVIRMGFDNSLFVTMLGVGW